MHLVNRNSFKEQEVCIFVPLLSNKAQAISSYQYKLLSSKLRSGIMIPLLTRKLHDVGSCLVTPDITHYTRGAGMSLTELPVIPPPPTIHSELLLSYPYNSGYLLVFRGTSIQNSSSSLFSGTSVGIISHVKYVLCVYIICTIYTYCVVLFIGRWL